MTDVDHRSAGRLMASTALLKNLISKVRLISEISVFSYLALGQIQKLGNL